MDSHMNQTFDDLRGYLWSSRSGALTSANKSRRG